jgi:PEGA domain
MTAGIVATGLLFFPAAPFFLFMHGKDISVPKGTEVPTFVSGNFLLDLAKFEQGQPTTPPAQSPSMQSSPSPQNVPGTNAEIDVTSTPPGAEIELDGTFVGSTPSTIGVTAGDHTITIKKTGFKTWERKMKVTSGKVQVSADLETADGARVQPNQ